MTKEAWNKGVDLGHSPYAFASANTKAAHDEQKEVEAPHKLLEKLSQAAQEQNGKGWQGFAQALQAVGTISNELPNIQRAMKDNILHWLKDSKLFAYGYAMPRNPGDTPVRLPDDVLVQRFVKWGQNQIKGNGLHFEAVRIAHPSMTLPKAQKRPGRPTGRDNILAAYEQIKEMGQINSSSLEKSAQIIQKHLMHNVLNTDTVPKGHSVQTIKKHIRDDFNQENSMS